jgi:hypothetical protein
MMSSSWSNVIETSNFDLVAGHCESCSTNAFVMLDVDDTIITPHSAIFRKKSKHKSFITKIKWGKSECKDPADAVSNWRLQRKIMLVDERWPSLIQMTRKRGVQVFAFTQLDTGKYGRLDRVEKWRYDELKSFGVTFSEKFLGSSELELLPSINDFRSGAAIFYMGLFITGGYNKMQMLPKILSKAKPSEIIFVDDLEENVAGLQTVCQEYGVPYTGILFRGADRIDGEAIDAVAEIQKAHLVQQGVWLEDDEAAARLGESE